LAVRSLFVCYRLNNAQIHFGMRGHACDFGGNLNLRPMPEFSHVSCGTTARSQTLCAIVSGVFVIADECPRISLATAPDIAPFLNPSRKTSKHLRSVSEF
jgi:hypothetical protein